MNSPCGVDPYFQAEASLVLLWVDEDGASSRNFTRGSERAVARQRRLPEDIVKGPCRVSVCQDWIGVSVREGECCDAEQRIAGKRASEVAQWRGYRDRASRAVSRSCLENLRWVLDDLTVLWRGRDTAVAWRYSSAGGGRGSRASEEDRGLAGRAVGAKIEDSVALFTCVACGEELPSYKP